jgi:Arc/MetJ-type ribon-helix-helix transcriptional regulator
MPQRHIQTRVPENVAEEIDTYQEHENHMNQSEAIRALLRAGLDAKQENGEEEEETAEYDVELHQDMGAVQLAGGAIIAVLVAVLLVASQPVAGAAAVAAAVGGAVGGSVR